MVKRKKYVVIYHDGNGIIKTDGIKVRSLSEQDIENMSSENLVCYFLLKYLNKKSILKPLLYIKENIV